jgi:3-hydroxybutyryl-CoA dehydrogenase
MASTVVQAVDKADSEFRMVGIIGGGLMGRGIAEIVASAEIPVTLVEKTPSLAERAGVQIASSLEREVAKDRLTDMVRERILGHVVVEASVEAIAECDLIIEAVTEDLEVKREVFSSLGEIAHQAAVLASNTSSIPISHLAAQVPGPERVLGVHFFAPVPRMKLVEVVKTLRTDPRVCDRIFRFVERLGKHHIESKDRSGFIVNFLLIPYLLSAIRLLEAGFATREAIDTGMKLGCGHPMGPLQLADLIGLDVVLAVAESLHAEFGEPEYSAPPLLRRMAALGLLGRKSGEGFYEYRPEGVGRLLVGTAS